MREITITVQVPDHVDSEQVWDIQQAAQQLPELGAADPNAEEWS